MYNRDFCTLLECYKPRKYLELDLGKPMSYTVLIDSFMLDS